MAHKKAAGSAKNLRDSQPKYRGIKLFGGQKAVAWNIIVRQKGSKYECGANTYLASDFTIHAAKNGIVMFKQKNFKRFDGRTYLKTVVYVSTEEPKIEKKIPAKKEAVKTEKKVEEKVEKAEIKAEESKTTKTKTPATKATTKKATAPKKTTEKKVVEKKTATKKTTTKKVAEKKTTEKKPVAKKTTTKKVEKAE